jgi:hypothetical protein
MLVKNKYWKFLILKAPHREPVRAVVAVHVGIATVEVQVLSVRSIHSTRPIVAVGAYIVERTIAVVAVARHRQLNISVTHHKTNKLHLTTAFAYIRNIRTIC